MSFCKFLVIALIAVLGTNTRAAVIWDESIHGDAGRHSAAAVQLGVLGVGEHTIITSGQWRSEGQNLTSLDLDFFDFEIPSGHLITGFRWDVEDLVFVGGIRSQSIQVALQSADSSQTYGQIVGYYNPAQFDGFDEINALLPLGTNSYRLIANNAGGVHLGDFSSTWASAATITVSALPEPHPIELLAVGSLALAWFRNRRRHPASKFNLWPRE